MSSNKPLVSVIVNCCNGEKYLREAIDSIYIQSYDNWEIIFWDNASTDRSAEIAKSYDERLKYFLASKTTHLGEARILAINESQGEYLSFLDCDDLWLYDKIEKQVKLFSASKSNAGFIYSRCEIISEDGETLGQINRENEYLLSGDIFGELVKTNFIPFVSVMISREKYYAVGGFPKHYICALDYDLFIKLSYKYEVLSLNEVLCKYREHTHNYSHSLYVIGAKESVDSVTNFLPDYRAQEGLRYQYVKLVTAYIKERRFYKAFVLLIKQGGWLLFFKSIMKKLKLLR